MCVQYLKDAKRKSVYFKLYCSKLIFEDYEYALHGVSM